MFRINLFKRNKFPVNMLVIVVFTNAFYVPDSIIYAVLRNTPKNPYFYAYSEKRSSNLLLYSFCSLYFSSLLCIRFLFAIGRNVSRAYFFIMTETSSQGSFNHAENKHVSMTIRTMNRLMRTIFTFRVRDQTKHVSA